VIFGAGPAGLTAALELCRAGVPNVVLEKSAVLGGISQTASYKGYGFDIGGHRFFTKVPVVEAFWNDVLAPEDFPTRRRLSRIYYRKRFFHYPLRVGNALAGLGLWNSARIVASYARARMAPSPVERTFDQWVTNRFGRRLFETFFKTYTEKVWGMPCSEIAADWAAQRIKGLSLTSALKHALVPQRTADTGAGAVITTLIDEFRYPRLGPGMMWERVAALVGEGGGSVELEAPAEVIHWSGRRVSSVAVGGAGGTRSIGGTDFISSLPIRELVRMMDPPPPLAVREAADRLRYRDFLTVALVIDNPDLFPDNWIYIHDPDVAVGRIQNFKNWSPDMVPDPDKTCLGLEYFCFEGDGLWTSTDEELVARGRHEVAALGLARAGDVVDGCVVRMPKAYPVYDGNYHDAIATLRAFFDQFENFQLVGRNGMHRYNNQDHSMLTAMLAVRNILGERHDLWSVNVEESYHEEVTAGEKDALANNLIAIRATERLRPTRIAPEGTTDS